MRLGVLIVAVLGLGVVPLVSGCGSSKSSSSSTESSSSGGGKKTVAGVQANDHGTKTASSSGKTELELDDFYFEPTVLTGEPGQELKIELENEGDNTHTFTSPDLDVDEEIEAGEDADVEVTLPDSSEVGFFCRFHSGQGMRGGFEVSG